MSQIRPRISDLFYSYFHKPDIGPVKVAYPSLHHLLPLLMTQGAIERNYTPFHLKFQGDTTAVLILC